MIFREEPPKRGTRSHDYWMSYSDLMAGLLLTFILLLVGVLIVSKTSLERTEEELHVREKRLKDAEAELKKVNTDLEQMLGVRAEIIRRLRKKFRKTGSNVSFDDATGAIRLGSDILFAEGSSRLTKKGQQTLAEFMPIYFEALLGDPMLRKHVGQIVFEGHTNSNYRSGLTRDSGYLFNLKLSQARAYEAMEYVIENRIGQGFRVKPLLAAIGYSSSKLRYETGRRIEDKEGSRRLEIRFRLKDEESLEQINRMLNRKPEGK